MHAYLRDGASRDGPRKSSCGWGWMGVGGVVKRHSYIVLDPPVKRDPSTEFRKLILLDMKFFLRTCLPRLQVGVSKERTAASGRAAKGLQPDLGLFIFSPLIGVERAKELK